MFPILRSFFFFFNLRSSHPCCLFCEYLACWSADLVFSRYLTIQGRLPGHGVPRRGRWVLWFGWLLGSLGLICGRKINKGMNEEIRKEKCHLSCSKWEVRPCWPYDRNTFQFICCKTQLAHTFHLYKTKTHKLKRSEIFFYPERDKALLNKSLP